MSEPGMTYKNSLKKSRRIGWKKFCRKIEHTGEASRIIKLLKGNSIVGNCTIKKDDNTFTNGPKETLELLFDKHSSSQLEEETEPPDTNDPNCDESFLQFITISTIREAIFSFKGYKSPGADRIFPVLLQEGFDIICDSLLEIYTDSIRYNTIPLNWTKSRVVFIPKPGRFEYISHKDFRPLSLTSFLLKGLEKLILWYRRKISYIQFTQQFICLQTEKKLRVSLTCSST